VVLVRLEASYSRHFVLGLCLVCNLHSRCHFSIRDWRTTMKTPNKPLQRLWG